MKKNRTNWENRISEYHNRMIENVNKIQNPNEVIEEAKAENEEDSESNKLSSFSDSSPIESSNSEFVKSEIEDLEITQNERPSKGKLNFYKQQSNIEERKSGFLDLI